MDEASRRRHDGDPAAALTLLERAHVLGQRDFARHLKVHWCMLQLAWSQRDRREVCGQLLRLVFVPLGHLTGRLPRGNIGTSRVSAFAVMPIAQELERLLDGDERSKNASS